MAAVTVTQRRVEPFAWPRIVPLALVAFQAWLIFQHSPWFDEVQALMIARAPWSELHRNLQYEGHPALWYLWIGSIDRALGGAPLSLPLAQLPISLAVTWLVWVRSPFGFTTKLLLGLSYFLFFEYGVVSRSYGLGALMLLAATAARGSIWSWVCLALAANTSVHFAAAAVALGAVLFSNKSDWRGASILACGLALAALTVLPKPHDLRLAEPLIGGPLTRMFVATFELGALITPAWPLEPTRWAHSAPIPLLPFVGVLAPFVGWHLMRGRVAKLAWIGLITSIWAIGAFVYGAFPRHVGALCLFIVCVAWIQHDPREKAPILLTAWLGLLAVCGVAASAGALVYPFSNAERVAGWIKTKGLEREAWGAWPGNAGVPVGAFLGRPIINIQAACSSTFTRWNYDTKAYDRAPDLIRQAGVRYVVAEAVEEPSLPLKVGRVIAQFPRSMSGPSVSIYRFEPSQQPAPPCGF